MCVYRALWNTGVQKLGVLFLLLACCLQFVPGQKICCCSTPPPQDSSLSLPRRRPSLIGAVGIRMRSSWQTWAVAVASTLASRSLLAFARQCEVIRRTSLPRLCAAKVHGVHLHQVELSAQSLHQLQQHDNTAMRTEVVPCAGMPTDGALDAAKGVARKISSSQSARQDGYYNFKMDLFAAGCRRLEQACRLGVQHSVATKFLGGLDVLQSTPTRSSKQSVNSSLLDSSQLRCLF